MCYGNIIFENDKNVCAEIITQVCQTSAVVAFAINEQKLFGFSAALNCFEEEFTVYARQWVRFFPTTC